MPLQRPEDLPWQGDPLHSRGWPAVPVPEPEVQEPLPPEEEASQAVLDCHVQETTQEGPGAGGRACRVAMGHGKVGHALALAICGAAVNES